jgi:hypothetical protein
VFGLFLAASVFSLSAADPTVYLIRYGEKPSDGGNGLSSQGEQRAQCLRNVFDASSGYGIGYIMDETPDRGMWWLFLVSILL